jgi:hypothetical protein
MADNVNGLTNAIVGDATGVPTCKCHSTTDISSTWRKSAENLAMLSLSHGR